MPKQVQVSRKEQTRKLRAQQAVKARRIASGEQSLRPPVRVYIVPKSVREL